MNIFKKGDKKSEENEQETIETAREQKLNELEILKQSLESEQKKTAEINDQFLRLAAEFNNYKNRIEKQKQELIDFAHKSLLISLLPLLDSFTKALETLYETKEDAHAGMQKIYDSLVDILKKEGLQKMETTEKPFDPNIHEAIGFEQRDDIEENIVTIEIHTGYMLHDKVLRPAMVRISKAAEKKEEPSEKNPKQDENKNKKTEKEE